eukprot:11226066-Lingulodinium_polyedra.AAC.1
MADGNGVAITKVGVELAPIVHAQAGLANQLRDSRVRVTHREQRCARGRHGTGLVIQITKQKLSVFMATAATGPD